MFTMVRFGGIFSSMKASLFYQSLAFGLMMNVDWFQPFSHNTYSVGAIYMTVMNLLRNVRYKRENVILCGLIPGPKDNPFFKPLVEELLDGVHMTVDGSKNMVRCAVLCIACDILAGQKICGLPWYTAHYACSRCKKYFQVHLVALIILDLIKIHGLQGLLASIAVLQLKYIELEHWLK